MPERLVSAFIYPKEKKYINILISRNRSNSPENVVAVGGKRVCVWGGGGGRNKKNKKK